MKTHPSLRSIEEAAVRLKDVVKKTPLEYSERLSKKFGAKIYLKREDLQAVRSYKIRGAFNRLSLLTKTEKMRGTVCASAGNHAQGVASSCAKLKIKATIFMPKNTPRQKIDRVNHFGGRWITLSLVGDTYDESCAAAKRFSTRGKKIFIHPFDDPSVIAGQGTVALEIFSQLTGRPDLLIVPIGGGGLASGTCIYAEAVSPRTEVIGVEPRGAASMRAALEAGRVVDLPTLDNFVDGAAVRTVGKLAFDLVKKKIRQVELVSEGQVCQEMIALYQNDGIIAEPAGALSIAALENLKRQIKGKTIVCVISGGNNDISRYPEVIERSLIFQGLKHYFIVNFSQRPGALRKFINLALGPTDDITLFEYTKKNNRETGPALVGIELRKKEDLSPLLKRLEGIGMDYELLRGDSVLSRLLT
jgi:threonine dehydratase